MANQLKVAKVLSIRALHEAGWSQRRIAREVGVSRGAVTRHLRKIPNEAEAPLGSVDSNGAKAPLGSDPEGGSSNGAKAPFGSGQSSSSSSFSTNTRSFGISRSMEMWFALTSGRRHEADE